eukprot:1395188-Amorphochlora_amoeboformis.AAC.1
MNAIIALSSIARVREYLNFCFQEVQLPYGGNMEKAMRLRDRAAIKILMNHRKQAKRRRTSLRLRFNRVSPSPKCILAYRRWILWLIRASQRRRRRANSRQDAHPILKSLSFVSKRLLRKYNTTTNPDSYFKSLS